MTRFPLLVVLCATQLVATPVAEAQFGLQRRTAEQRLTGSDRRQLDVLGLIMEDAERSGDSEERARFFLEYLNTSEPFVRDHPQLTTVWAGRALAAVELNRIMTAWDAGQSLLRLRADRIDHPQVRRALAVLERRGWLGPDPPQPGPTAGEPWKNSLGMRFVAIDDTDAFFSIWETRVRDFSAFVDDTGHDATSGMLSFYTRESTWRRLGASWRLPGFDQSPDHPVIGINWYDARAFCAWLTEKERREGVIAPNQEYRLPTEAEWSIAAGPSTYPWGEQWPPPAGVGNFLGEENLPTDLRVLEGYDDGVKRTARVGSFAPNRFGLYDFGGNVSEWCEETPSEDGETASENAADAVETPRSNTPVIRGASWSYQNPANLSTQARHSVEPDHRIDDVGFRCVLAVATDLHPEVEIVSDDDLPTRDLSMPRPVHRVQPDYPSAQRTGNVSGTVVIEFTIDERGRVLDPVVVSSTHPAFESAALAAVRDWRFEPAEREGEPVASRVLQEFRFNPTRLLPTETR